MRVKDVNQEVAEKSNPFTDTGRDLYRGKTAEQAEIDQLNSLYHAPARGDSERNTPKRQTSSSDTGKLGVVAQQLRRKSSMIAISLVLVGGGGAATIFMSPTLAIVQMRQVLTQDLNDQLKSFDDRSAKVMRVKLKSVPDDSCGASKACHQFSEMSDKQSAKYTERGVDIERDAEKRVTKMTVTDPDNGKKISIVNDVQYDKLTKGDVVVRAAFTKAYRPSFVSLGDGVALKVMKEFKTSKASKIKGTTDEEREKSIHTATAGDESMTSNNIHEKLDEQGKPTGKYVDDKGVEVDQSVKNGVDESAKLSEEVGKIGSKNILTSGVVRGVQADAVVDQSCTVYNASRMVAALSKIKKVAMAVRFVMAKLLVPADKIMAGDSDPDEATFVGNAIMASDDRDEVVDEASWDKSNTTDKPPMIKNPKKGSNAWDSLALKTVLHQDVGKQDARSSRFLVGGGFTGTFDKINRYLAAAINGGNDDPHEVSRKCRVVQNNYVRVGAAVIGIIAGVGSLGISTAAGVAGSLMVSMALPYILSVASDVMAGNLFDNLSGMDFGDGSFIGVAGLLGTIALRRGMKPLSAREAVAYTSASKVNQAKYAETERYLARSTPFDINNQYSFLGGIASGIGPLVRQGGNSASQMALAVGAVFPTVLSLSTPAKADAPLQRFEQCNDPAYRDLNIGADIFCNVRYGLSDEELGMDPLDNVAWMVSSGNIDADSGAAKDNSAAWNYVKFLKECANRTVGWGEDQDENQGDGKECVKPENEPLNKHFRIYTIDKSVNDAMNETGQLPGTAAYNSGEKNPVSSDGWSFPTVQDASITSGYKPADRPDHKGVDLVPQGGALDKPIFAARDGVVMAAGPADGFGNWIVISHNIDGKRVDTVYGHMFNDGVLVKTGDTVRAGQQIGKIGNNGNSTGPHLHFEIRNGSVFDGVDNSTDPTEMLEKARKAK